MVRKSRVRSPVFSACSMSAHDALPQPTAYSSPAMMRTMLYKNPLPVTRTSYSSAPYTGVLSTVTEKTVRTVVFAEEPVARNAAKSCSPTSRAAASRMRARSTLPSARTAYRSRRGIALAAV